MCMPGITEEEDQIHNNDDEKNSGIPNPLDIIRRERDKKRNGPGVPTPSP